MRRTIFICTLSAAIGLMLGLILTKLLGTAGAFIAIALGSYFLSGESFKTKSIARKNESLQDKIEKYELKHREQAMRLQLYELRYGTEPEPSNTKH